MARNSNVSFELRWIPATSVDAAMGLLLKICRVARGVVSVTPLAEPRPACPRFVHAANAALNQIGRIARGAMAPASKSKTDRRYPDKRYSSKCARQTLPATADAIHAVLPMVSSRSQKSDEDNGQQRQVRVL